MIRRPPRSTLSSSSAASDVYKRQIINTVDHDPRCCLIHFEQNRRSPAKSHCAQSRPQIVAPHAALRHVRKAKTINFNRFDETQRDSSARAFGDVVINGEEIGFCRGAENDRVGHRAERLTRLVWCCRKRANTFSAGWPRGSRL